MSDKLLDDSTTYYLTAGGLWVQSEPVGKPVMTGGSENDVLAIDADQAVKALTLSGSNVGTSGVGVFKEKSVGEFRFKKIKAGTDITVTATGTDEVEIASTASGGGGGSVPDWVSLSPDALPASANSADDEFNDATGMSGSTNGLNARWSWVNQSTATATYNNGLVLTIPSAGSTNLRGIEQTLPSAPWRFRAKIASVGARANFFQSGLWLRDGSGKIISLHRGWASNPLIEWNWWNSVTAYNSTPSSFPLYDPTAWGWWYMEIQDDNTNLIFRYSASGEEGSFVRWRSESRTAFMASGPTKIGLFANDQASNGAKTFCRWFRRMA